jgi:hypothetical protein
MGPHFLMGAAPIDQPTVVPAAETYTCHVADAPATAQQVVVVAARMDHEELGRIVLLAADDACHA